MMSSTRFRNSGLKCPCSASITCFDASLEILLGARLSACKKDDPRFEVMMMTVFLKSTVRPLPSVSRPSSMICKQHVEHIRMRLFDLVEQHHGIRPPPNLLGELPAFLIAQHIPEARQSAAKPHASPCTRTYRCGS